MFGTALLGRLGIDHTQIWQNPSLHCRFQYILKLTLFQSINQSINIRLLRHGRIQAQTIRTNTI